MGMVGAMRDQNGLKMSRLRLRIWRWMRTSEQSLGIWSAFFVRSVLFQIQKLTRIGFARESIKKYINSTNRLMVGERTVMVLNPRIVQRSYGTEKRLVLYPIQRDEKNKRHGRKRNLLTRLTNFADSSVLSLWRFSSDLPGGQILKLHHQVVFLECQLPTPLEH